MGIAREVNRHRRRRGGGDGAFWAFYAFCISLTFRWLVVVMVAGPVAPQIFIFHAPVAAGCAARG